MKHTLSSCKPRSTCTGRFTKSNRSTLLAAALFAALYGAGGLSHAVEFGPDNMFKFSGFGEVTLTRSNNQCKGVNGCQFDPDTDRQRVWTDDVVPGTPLGNKTRTFSQIRLELEGRYSLGKGFKLQGLLAQNSRDGAIDTPGFWRERNLGISHEEYGTLTLGATTSRTWGFADYPFGTKMGNQFFWSSSGAGYRNLGHAIRYTSRVFDVAEGDLVMEITYDKGNPLFTINKPRLIELWSHYGRGPLQLDFMYQDARNGVPSAFGAAAFDGVFYSPVADGKVGSSGQSVGVLQGSYLVNPQLEVLGGVRRNRWSGAYAAVVVPGVLAQWNNMFNVDWGGTLNGVSNPGYAATSTDLVMGASYRMDKWTFSTGMVYNGKANTANPSERGQSNSAIVNTFQAKYAYTPELELSAFAGMVHFKNKGLAPLSMPANTFVNNIDSRTTKAGNWFGVGAKYSF
jgi:hypothetical protein